jgi:hypothetical protein
MLPTGIFEDPCRHCRLQPTPQAFAAWRGN